LADGKKSGKDYQKQIENLGTTLVSMAKKAKVAPGVIEDLEKAFKDIGKGSATGSVDKIKTALEGLRMAS
jgi:thymidylate synthase ThyX